MALWSLEASGRSSERALILSERSVEQHAGVEDAVGIQALLHGPQ